MGLPITIVRGDPSFETLNVFRGRTRVTVTNISGPFEPTEDAPAALLSTNAFGDAIIVPVLDEPVARAVALLAGPMFGGTFAHTSDSRFAKAAGIYGAVPVHDRYEGVAR